VTAFSRHFHAIFTPFSRHFDAKTLFFSALAGAQAGTAGYVWPSFDLTGFS